MHGKTCLRKASWFSRGMGARTAGGPVDDARYHPAAPGETSAYVIVLGHLRTPTHGSAGRAPSLSPLPHGTPRGRRRPRTFPAARRTCPERPNDGPPTSTIHRDHGRVVEHEA